jgi:hypothetical protein
MYAPLEYGKSKTVILVCDDVIKSFFSSKINCPVSEYKPKIKLSLLKNQ